MIIIFRLLLANALAYGLTVAPVWFTFQDAPTLSVPELVHKYVPKKRHRHLVKVNYDVEVTRYGEEYHEGQDPVEF